MAQTETTRKSMEFPKSYCHTEVLREFIDTPHHACCLKVPYCFSIYGSYEVREAIIDAYNSCRDVPAITEYSQEIDDWEDLINFLKKDAGWVTDHKLFIKVLSGYLFHTSGRAKMRAIRLALSFMDKENPLGSISGQAIAKIVAGCLKNRDFFGQYEREPEIIELKKLHELEGLFGLLPEVKPLLQKMLKSLYEYGDIILKNNPPRIWYGKDDFFRVERALRIILQERDYDTSFLPFISKMAADHYSFIREMQNNPATHQHGDIDKSDLWFYDRNQSVLDSTLRLLLLADKDNTANRPARIQRILKKYDQ